MNTDDFRYMRRGIPLEILEPEAADIIKPIEQYGSKKQRALLLLHGFSSTPAVYREIIPQLSHYDAIVCPVLPGHGESIAAFAQIKALDWINAAENACAILVKEYAAVDVLGLSLGGVLACHLSQKFTLNHLYLLAPALDLHSSITKMIWYGRILYTLGFKYVRNQAGNLLTDHASELAYRQLPVATILELLKFLKNFQFVAPTCPTELFLGQFDAVVDSKKVAKRFENLSNTHIHWMSNSAHVLPLDGDVAEILACIEKY
jgi:carboxylesterase